MVFLCGLSPISNVIGGSLFFLVNLHFGLGLLPFDYEYRSEKKGKKKNQFHLTSLKLYRFYRLFF
jgi:hypothetical protein